MGDVVMSHAERRRFELLGSYLKELHDIKGVESPDDVQLVISYEGYKSEPNTEWIDILGGDGGGEIIGFLMIGYPPNCHPHANFYIEEAYITPEHRGRGHMTRVASSFIESHEGVYCLFILNDNSAALRFWPKLFAKHGYTAMELCDVGAGDPYCKQYGFKKRESP